MYIRTCCRLVYDMVGSKKTILHGRPHNRGKLPSSIPSDCIYNVAIQDFSIQYFFLCHSVVSEEAAPAVDEALQEEFFQKVLSQLHTITEFYRMEETRLQFSLTELQGQVI